MTKEKKLVAKQRPRPEAPLMEGEAADVSYHLQPTSVIVRPSLRRACLAAPGTRTQLILVKSCLQAIIIELMCCAACA
jgi:hypothetical protein